MNCSHCGNAIGDGTVKILDGKLLHSDCYDEISRRKIDMAENIIDAEITEEIPGTIEETIDSEETTFDTTETEVPNDKVAEESKPDPKCEISVGMEPNGNLYFLARGEDPSLLNIEGLIRFAQLKMAKIWEERMEPTEAVHPD